MVRILKRKKKEVVQYFNHNNIQTNYQNEFNQKEMIKIFEDSKKDIHEDG